MPRDPLSEVQFQASFEAPPGQDIALLLADFLVAKLTTFSVRCSDPQEAGDAFTVGCVIGRRRFQMSVDRDGPVDGEWLISIASGLGRIRRLFRAGDEAERRHLVRALHTILDGDERITKIRWNGIADLGVQPGEGWWEDQNR